MNRIGGRTRGRWKSPRIRNRTKVPPRTRIAANRRGEEWVRAPFITTQLYPQMRERRRSARKGRKEEGRMNSLVRISFIVQTVNANESKNQTSGSLKMIWMILSNFKVFSQSTRKNVIFRKRRLREFLSTSRRNFHENLPSKNQREWRASDCRHSDAEPNKTLFQLRTV